jgi:hypothetical protein
MPRVEVVGSASGDLLVPQLAVALVVSWRGSPCSPTPLRDSKLITTEMRRLEQLIDSLT